ncbi:hypothetical protein EYC84_006295 [Monilinia fructicola]|uniref:Uncharacterized protein n=1 Tax=Monilinia fructicola TaxID=38448 RepID=A0A5M9K7E0_MONFR|nr:hypothetical protein EYC84_006295 [Monilinia fructicola]
MRLRFVYDMISYHSVSTSMESTLYEGDFFWASYRTTNNQFYVWRILLFIWIFYGFHQQFAIWIYLLHAV